MSKKFAIGIDLGGTNLRVALVSEDGEIIRKIKRPSSDRIVASILESIDEIGHREVLGIGLGIAGLIDRKNNRVFASPNLRAVEGVDIVGEIRKSFDVPVFMENDANVAALGEKIGGAGRDFDNFVLLTLGTGIGGGMIYRGELLDVSAEIGHMSINADAAEKCPCGNIGCLENYASARAMISKAVALLEKGHGEYPEGMLQGQYLQNNAGRYLQFRPRGRYAVEGDPERSREGPRCRACESDKYIEP